MDVAEQLQAIAASGVSASQRPAAYLEVLDQLLAQSSAALDGEALIRALSQYLDQAAFSDANASGGNLVVGRQVLTDFDVTIARVAKAAASVAATAAATAGVGHGADEVMTDAKNASAIADDEVHRQVLEMALEKVQPRVLSFEEQAASLRHHLADLLEESEDWLGAARVLQGISLDSGHRNVSDLAKLRTYVRIVRLLLEGDDAVGADVVLKRASLLVHNVPGVMSADFGGAYATQQQQTALSSMSEGDLREAKTLGLQYKLSQARIYDAQRRFAEAAFRFHEVSYVAEIDEGERNMMLSAAVTASILAPAGPQRSRILATLTRDERTEALPQHTILRKVFLDQIIRPAEVASFAELLSPHQRAALPKTSAETAAQQAATRSVRAGEDAEMRSARETNDDDDEDEEESERMGPSTVLDRAMMEHNIIATSRLYTNITLGGLGSLLDVSKAGAETMVRRMIAQGRLRADIDQVAGLVLFHEQPIGPEFSGSVAGAGAGTAAEKEGGGTATTTSGAIDATGASVGALANSEGADDASTVYTRRWDAGIANIASGVEQLCARLRARGLVSA